MRNRFASPDSQRKYLQFRLRSKDFRSPTPAFTILKIGEYRRAFALAARWRIVFLVCHACLRESEMQALVRRRTCPRGTRNEPCRMSSRTTLLGSMGIALTFSSRPHSETRLTRTSRQRFWKNGWGSGSYQPAWSLEPRCVLPETCPGFHGAFSKAMRTICALFLTPSLLNSSCRTALTDPSEHCKCRAICRFVHPSDTRVSTACCFAVNNMEPRDSFAVRRCCASTNWL